MHPDHHTDRLGRTTTTVVDWVSRHPWAVLLAGLALTAVSVWLSYEKLEYHTQRNDLLSADKPCQKRWQKFLDAFGDDDDMVVVAEGTDRERMKAALDDVAAEVRNRPDQFDRVFHRADLRPVADRALLYLAPEEIATIVARIDRMEPLLGDFAPLTWRKLSVQSLLGNGAVALEKRATGRDLTAAESDLIALLPTVASTAAATVRDPAAYRNVWAVAEQSPTSAGVPRPGAGEGMSMSTLSTPQYFFTPDGSLALLMCRPKKTEQSFAPAQEATDAMGAILADVGRRHPDVALGLTGLPVIESDEMVVSDVDSTRASWLALAGVALLYLVAYRGFRYPFLTVGALIVGTMWALGWATLTVGHLNILSATFAVMLIGMGDYGVLWVAQYDEQRKLGRTRDAATHYTAGHAGPSVIVAALGTALAFFATMLADFKAVAELGWIAGCGVLFCAAACLTVLPAVLAILERWREAWCRWAGAPSSSAPLVAKVEPTSAPGGTEEDAHPTHTGSAAAEPTLLPFPSSFLPVLTARPRLVLVAGAVLLLVCAVSAGWLQYDHNLLHLQARGTDSVAWEHKLIDRAAGATWDAMSIARTREEALALKAKYEALPSVSKVVEVASLVPDQQERKLPQIAALRAKLAGLPPVEKLPTPTGSNPAAVRELAARIAKLAGSDAALAGAAAELDRAVRESPDPAPRLKEFDRRLGTDLAEQLHALKRVSRPDPITLDDVPPELRERFLGASGEYLVRAFAKESLWDYPALRQFTSSAQSVDPEATGKSFRTLEGLRQMKSGFEWAGVYALLAIVVVLAVDFRRAAGVLVGLLPLAVGIVFTLGSMALCGLSLNPANMIALPLIVGVGVDNGVHVLHDYRARDRRRAYRLSAATGRGVLVAGLTTVLGFGTMLIARHEGMASLGLALTIGVSCCMVAALVLLPAMLHLRDCARLNRAHAPIATVLPIEKLRGVWAKTTRFGTLTARTRRGKTG